MMSSENGSFGVHSTVLRRGKGEKEREKEDGGLGKTGKSSKI